REAGNQLPVASYKLSAKSTNGRGVYSFCMCPGGYVVNASSEEKHLAINGMSYSKRDSGVANSAIIVSVTPKDYSTENPLAGIAYQRELEENAYRLANGKIPLQYYGDFSGKPGKMVRIKKAFAPCLKGEGTFVNLHGIMPKELDDAFIEGMEQFGKIIPGFDDDFTIIAGVESRTSSPVRITRNTCYQSEVKGIYPCGEGAGYAGGITSAAMDGITVAEAVASKYNTLE
ncbi:MAG: FAD-dependent oxidoreductase, partial [Lachnospiraceae bacterium]|nr:FAD-dependent oxidoreductase [Lachnospiraceae bacterium]